MFVILIVKIANDNDGGLVVSPVSLERTTVPLQQFRQVRQQNPFARVFRIPHIARDTSYTSISMNTKGRISSSQCFREYIQRLLPGQIFDEDLNVHRSPCVEIIAVPQPAKRQAFFYEIVNGWVVAGPPDLREPIFTLFEDPDFVRRHCVDKIWLMGSHENLGTRLLTIRMIAKFLRESVQQFVVQPIFRLLNT